MVANEENNNVVQMRQYVGIDPELMKQAEAQQEARKTEDAKVLTSLEGFSFTSWGYSFLKITRNGVSEKWKIPIKSIGISDVTEALEQNAPTPPSIMKTYKKDTPEARAITNGRFDVVVREIDESDPSFVAMRRKHEREVGQLFVMYGLALDVKDPQTGELVIAGSDLNSPTVINDREKAIKALRKLGLSQTHYTQLMTDIRNLTADVEEAEREE